MAEMGHLSVTIYQETGSRDTGLVLTRNGEVLATVRLQNVLRDGRATLQVEAPADVKISREQPTIRQLRTVPLDTAPRPR